MRVCQGGTLLSVLVVAACAGEGIDVPVATQIAIVADTDGQGVPAGGRIPSALAVMVSADDGTPVPRAEVRWTIVEGTGASLSDSVTLSDGTGRAEVSLTLGSEPGTYVIRAALVVDASQAVLFSLEATSPPRLSAVVPETFAGGDTILLRGTSLPDSLRVEIGGALARLVGDPVTGQGLSAELSVEVPPCLVPGPVAVRVLVDATSSNVLIGTYQASGNPVVLAPGQYVSIDPEQLQGCATFPDAGSGGAEYLLVPQSLTGVPGMSADYRLAGDSAVPVVPAPPRPPAELPFATRFHDFLRGREAEISRLPKPSLEAGAAVAEAAQIDVGDERRFRVCDKVTCSRVEDFAEVTATAAFVGEHAVIYHDKEAPGGFTGSDFEALGVLFDDELYTVASRAFGIESDVDRNGRIIILMTPVVNGLTPKEQCETSFVTGFFFALDVDPAFQKDVRSNRAEVFYAITPDALGTVTCAHTASRVLRLVPVTFIHELQHMISYNQHVLLRDGRSELVWLNEGMSHLAEELGALHFEGLGDQVRFSQFSIGDLFNAYSFLNKPGVSFTLFSEGTGSLAERGAAWLLLRWLVDQFGEGILRRLSETSLTGADNVGAATGEPFARIMAEAFTAHYVSDLPDFTAPARLRHVTWRFRTTYASLNEQLPERFDLPFPIVPEQFTGPTFVSVGTLHSGSGEYFSVVQTAGQWGFTVRLEDSSGSPLGGAVVPRLNIVRIR